MASWPSWLPTCALGHCAPACLFLSSFSFKIRYEMAKGAKRLSVFLSFYGTFKRLSESIRELQFELKWFAKKITFLVIAIAVVMWSWTSQKGSFSLSSSGLQKKIFVLLAFICLFFSSRFIGRLFFWSPWTSITLLLFLALPSHSGCKYSSHEGLEI